MTSQSAVANGALKLDINIEAPFVKVVQECIVKTFKSHKKFIEKEVSNIVNKITQVKKTGSSKGASHVIENLEALSTKLNQLKAKYTKMIEVEDYLIEVMRKRIKHISNVVENHGNTEVMKDYFTKRLNRVIIDYLLRENYFESAKIFIEETGLKDFVDFEVFEESSRILEKLKKRDCKEALEWCNTHKTKLQKSNSQLELKLRVQEFIEHIKRDEKMKAVEYAQKHFTKFDSEPEMTMTLGQVMSLIAFRQKDLAKHFHYMYFSDEKRWHEIEDLFLKESFSLYGQPDTAMINQTIQTGIPVMKMEFCMNDTTFNDQCPTCSRSIRRLGQKLPFSHHAQTCIKCDVTGEMMNDQNQPLYLPSGYVVSERAIEKIIIPESLNAGNANVKIVCPFTKQQYLKNEIRKVYFS